jgi:hypothetical protein
MDPWMFPVPVLRILEWERRNCVTSPVHLSRKDLTYEALKERKAHRTNRMCWMAFDDGLLPLNGWRENGRTNGGVLVYRPCKKGHELHENAQGWTPHFARDKN